LGEPGAAADGAKWTKKGPVQEFKANIGIVVAVKDRDTFPSLYAKTVKTVCKNNSVEWNRPFCKGSDLRYVTGSNATTNKLIAEIIQGTRSEINQVLIVYTLLFPSAVPKVYIYTSEQPTIPLSPMDFQDKIEHPYPYLCLWAYLQNLAGQKPFLASDHFAGEVTSAWEDLEAQCPPSVFFDGSNTNAMVSMADILVRILNERIGQQRLSEVLDPTTLPSFLPELTGSIDTFYLGQRYLKKMVPQKRLKINTAPHIAHPILFVVKEPTSILTSEFISRSTMMDGIYNAAVKLGGCTKFFEQKDPNDQRLIQPGDYFLWVGEHGKRFVESLRGLGYKGLKCGEATDVEQMAKI
jgi:hypothetical protein